LEEDRTELACKGIERHKDVAYMDIHNGQGIDVLDIDGQDIEDIEDIYVLDELFLHDGHHHYLLEQDNEESSYLVAV